MMKNPTRILIPNLGSSSLKYKIIEMPEERVVRSGKFERIGSNKAEYTSWNKDGNSTKTITSIPDHSGAIQLLVEDLEQSIGVEEKVIVDAIGFKTVHAGPHYCGSFLITEDLIASLEEFTIAAAVHNPIYLKAIRSFGDVFKDVPMIAVFETGFHKTIPEKAHVYGVPYEWTKEMGIRRYGFHGASHRYVSERVPKVQENQKPGLKIISCHLGGSSSVCAIRDGKSIDCSFGFSPQSGLIQGTRCGELDPSVLLYVMTHKHINLQQTLDILYSNGGLLGISGISGDMQDLLTASSLGESGATLAINTYVHEVKKYIGAFSAIMNGVDVISFSGGIGENSREIRKEICNEFDYLGLQLDDEKNNHVEACDTIISARNSKIEVIVIHTNEEIIVARETMRILDRRK